MNTVSSWLKRSARTKTDIHTQAEEKQQRMHSLAASYRLLASVQIFTQLLLWATLWLFEEAVQASWQAMLLQIAPAILLWGLWRALPQRRLQKSSRWIRLLLLPCLWLDATVLFVPFVQFSFRQLLSWSVPWVAVVAGFIWWLTVATSGSHGVAFGVQQFKWLLLAGLALSLLTFSSGDPTRLFPFWARGIPATLQAALGGIGSMWGVALLFIAPRDARPLHESDYGQTKRGLRRMDPSLICLAACWLLAMVCVFWLVLCAPIGQTADAGVGEKLFVMAWRSSGVILFQISIMFWLFLLPCALAGTASFATMLVEEAMPRPPRALTSLLFVLVPVALSFLPSEAVMQVVRVALPWRLVPAVLCGGIILLVERRRKQ